jgi:hypothetical protein
MPGRREAAHVAADFGEDDASAQSIDAGNGGQELDGGAKGLDMSVDLPIDVGHHLVDGADVLQMKAQQEAVMPGDAAAQRFAKGLGRRLDAAMCQLGQLLQIAFARRSRLRSSCGQTDP